MAETSSSTATPSSTPSSITPVTNQNNQQSDANSITVVSSQPNKNQTKEHVNSIAEDGITSEASEENDSVNLYYDKNQEEIGIYFLYFMIISKLHELITTFVYLIEEQPIYPKAFHNMSNEFEVAVWIAQHPRILNLAIEIQNAKSTLVNKEGSQVQEVQASTSYSNITPLEIDQVI